MNGKANILLVDDRPENLLALEAAMEPLGQNVVTASSGEEALRKLMTGDFAVILLDVQMPGMDGFETAEQIKKRERTKDVPILFLTAISREPHHALKGYSSGAVDYLSKPIDPFLLRAKVAVFIELHEKNSLLKKQAELLQQRARELERSNSDLTQFAYVASHDLQEPLRIISGYLDLLKDGYTSSLSEDALGLLERIGRSAQRMDTLIQDLLEFARVGAPSVADVDSGEALSEALANLEVALKEAAAEVTFGSWPNVVADRSQLARLFQNLIGNAIKFRDDRSPRIQVDAEERHNEYVFVVKDNGIGMGPQDVERVFGFFERLHSRDRYPGSGIGLPVCKRIVEGHGGRIWAESELGSGTTMYFTLPVSAAQEPDPPG